MSDEPATLRNGYALVQFYYSGGPRDGQPFEQSGVLIPHSVEHRDWGDSCYKVNAPGARFEWRSARD